MTQRAAPLSCRRSDFFLGPGDHYLNCAYMSPLPRVAEEAGIRGIRRKRVPSGIQAEDFFADGEELRRLFAALVGARDASRVAILPAASYGLAVAARNLDLHAGRNVVLTQEQFPSNVYVWHTLARERGLEVRTVEPPEGEGRGREWNARILEAVDGDTAVVALGHVHWTDGTLFDLEAVGARARETGAALVVDGTQSVGALPLDVESVRPDALVCAGYKWLLGPYSLALGYFGPRFDEGVPLEENWIAREGSEDFRGLVDYQAGYQPGAARYDVGERSNFVLVPMLVASLRLLVEWRPERVQAYCRELVEPILQELRGLGVALEEQAWRASHILGLRMPPGMDLAEVGAALERRGVSASLRGSALRVSPNAYNDAGDLEALMDALRAAL